MASKTARTKPQPAKARPARKAAAAAPAAAPAPAPGGAKGLLRAGLKALNDVRDDVITRQSRVFEALLGLPPSLSASDRSAKEWKLLNAGEDGTPGMQKFEEIFDQRVARSLERLGMPSPQALAALCRQLESINEHLKRIESTTTPRRAPRRRPTRSST
ncbi:phasin family protein [Piscinibacter sp. XHJ-5]|uniref:phasin family protein n=1 Tax=Piscinibacter sp. XHJ-5 TaxID=3037797 RepID=UPI0024529E33|nr:phasin family protein [Piscinibacter sp. XHJ-5]